MPGKRELHVLPMVKKSFKITQENSMSRIHFEVDDISNQFLPKKIDIKRSSQTQNHRKVH